jgi:formate dehydrogenase (NADP+) alpha subunit
MSAVKITINDQELEVAAGTTILEAARELGIDIPTLCHDPELPPNGACRLCVVEVEKAKSLVASCVTPVTPGMVVHTESTRVVSARREILSLLIANHPLVCITCERTGSCKLQDYCYRYGVADSDFVGETKELPLDASNAFFVRDMNKCILCGICVGKCQEIVGAGAIDFTRRGFMTNVGPAYEDKIEDSTCVFCGLCIDSCPVGALIPKASIGKGRSWQVEKTKTICPYCGVGCGIYLQTRDGEVVDVLPDFDHPASRGHLCARGKFGWDYLKSAERLTTPLVRSEGVFVAVSWEEALGLIVDQLEEIRGRFGPAALMGLCSPKASNEESYLFQKLIRSLGSNNVDSYSRHCHAPAVEGMMKAFGGAAMTNSMEELVSAQAIFLIEADPLTTHPIIGYRIREAVKKGACLIAAQSVEAGLSDLATHYLPIKTGTAVALANAFAAVILEEKLHNAEFINKRTEGFADYSNSLGPEVVRRASALTGISEEQLRQAARAFAGAATAAIVSTAGGSEQEGDRRLVTALTNLALLTGNVGRENCGLYLPYSENNLQGSADMGALPAVLTGYQPLKEKAVREKFARAWKADINDTPGLSAAELFGAVGRNQVKAMLVMGENPAACGEHHAVAADLLSNLDFLVVQDLFMTETAMLADVILPAAGFAEKTATYTNVGRRVQLNRAAIDPPGDAQPDWAILAELAGWLGFEWEYEGPEDIFAEMAALTPQYAGISYERIAGVGLQWPCPHPDHPGSKYLYEGRFLRGLGLFTPIGSSDQDKLPLRHDENCSEAGGKAPCSCLSDSMRNHSVISKLK